MALKRSAQGTFRGDTVPRDRRGHGAVYVRMSSGVKDAYGRATCSVLQLILLAVFLALWLEPFVEFLGRRRVPRVVAILAAYLTLFASVLFLGLVVVPPIANQIDKGVSQLPAGISKLRENATFRKYDNTYK